MALPDAARFESLARSVPVGGRTGVLTQVVGLLVECRGLNSALGDLCRVEGPDGESLDMEVVGFRGASSLLMPLGESHGLRPGARVIPKGCRLDVQCSEAVLGRVLDGLGHPIDGGPAISAGRRLPLVRQAPMPLERENIDEPLPTGVSVLDGFLTLGRGQRIGIFSGSGVGKSTLLGDIARGTTADVNVIALIGERGREVRHFIEESLGPEGLRRSVLIVATSDAPPLIRIKACFTAVAIAEWFRDLGKDVMMMVDSVTRLAGATREVGLALGEPPTVRGYPPSFFSSMPRIVERLGRTQRGSITGIFTVLVDGDDMNEPVTDTLRGLLDGHVVLSRAIAQRGRFPAVDVLQSTSRIMDRVTSDEHRADAREVRMLMAAFEDARDLVSIGAYKPGNDAKVDRALAVKDALDSLLTQDQGTARAFEDTLARLAEIAGRSAS
ncbi:MAG: FliI/YscN family ATPase [Planctomycetes bacterium]|nr:FliI/YscN family ATPase [Planctomycetota bacterium]